MSLWLNSEFVKPLFWIRPLIFWFVCLYGDFIYWQNWLLDWLIKWRRPRLRPFLSGGVMTDAHKFALWQDSCLPLTAFRLTVHPLRLSVRDLAVTDNIITLTHSRLFFTVTKNSIRASSSFLTELFVPRLLKSSSDLGLALTCKERKSFSSLPVRPSQLLLFCDEQDNCSSTFSGSVFLFLLQLCCRQVTSHASDHTDSRQLTCLSWLSALASC